MTLEDYPWLRPQTEMADLQNYWLTENARRAQQPIIDIAKAAFTETLDAPELPATEAPVFEV